MYGPIALLADECPSALRRERRVAVRFRCSATTPCPFTILDQPGNQTARVRDVSIVGVGLLVRRRVMPGTPVTLMPERPGGGTPLALQARVVHATQRDGADWLVGCVFTRPLTDEELEAMLAY
jgi:hypothetical protein